MISLPLQNYSDATDPNQLRPGLEAEQVSPGLIGFLITFVMVAVVVALIVDMVRRQRRLRYRADYARRREQEQAAGPSEEQAAGRGGSTTTGSTAAGAPGGAVDETAVGAEDRAPTGRRTRRTGREEGPEHEAPGPRD